MDVDEGLEMSCPNGGSGEGARASVADPTCRGGRLLSIGSGLALRSTGADPWKIGGSVKAVVTVVDGESSDEPSPVLYSMVLDCRLCRRFLVDYSSSNRTEGKTVTTMAVAEVT